MSGCLRQRAFSEFRSGARASELLYPFGSRNGAGHSPTLQVVFTTIVSVIVTTPAAYLAWRYIETPAIKFGRRFGKQSTLLVAG
jgi:peptidoglycan/LPS O-acetylase OafA/YrhL